MDQTTEHQEDGHPAKTSQSLSSLFNLTSLGGEARSQLSKSRDPSNSMSLTSTTSVSLTMEDSASNTTVVNIATRARRDSWAHLTQVQSGVISAKSIGFTSSTRWNPWALMCSDKTPANLSHYLTTFRIWLSYILPNIKKTRQSASIEAELLGLTSIYSEWVSEWKDQVTLENVQRRATRLVKSLQGKSYPERLKSLWLSSLEYTCRRLRNDMVQTYKIVRDIDIVDTDKLFTMNTDTRSRGHKYKLFKRRSRLNIRKNVFSN